MTNITKSRLLIDSSTANVVSAPITIDNINTSIVAQIIGSGTVSARINVYTGIWDSTKNNWAIKTLDSIIDLSGNGTTDLVSGRVNMTTLSRTIQLEVTNLSGTGAAISVGVFQTNGEAQTVNFDGILIDNLKSTSTTTSKVVKVSTTVSSVLTQLSGTGSISATLNIYGGMYSESRGIWLIKVLDRSIPLSGTDLSIYKENLSLITKHIQFEITGLTGTEATISAGLVNAL